MTAGLTIGLLIFIYVADEWKYDRFFPHADSLYRITTHWNTPEKQESYATTPSILKEEFRQISPDIAGIGRLLKWNDFTLRPETDFERVFRETEVYYADSSIFEVFGFTWLEGDPTTALKSPGSFVLPRSTAIKYFGEEAVAQGNLVGKHLLIGKDGGTAAKITGIIADIPAQSHLQFDMLLSASSIRDIMEIGEWSWNIVHTYIRLHPDRQAQSVQQQLQQLVNSKAIPYMGYTESSFLAEGNTMEYRLQPLTAIPFAFAVFAGNAPQRELPLCIHHAHHRYFYYPDCLYQFYESGDSSICQKSQKKSGCAKSWEQGAQD